MSAHSFDTRGLDQCPFIPVFGAPSIMFERGSGTELFDVDGKRYLDFLSGIAVVSLGHANPAIVSAVQKQAETLMHVTGSHCKHAINHYPEGTYLTSIIYRARAILRCEKNELT